MVFVDVDLIYDLSRIPRSSGKVVERDKYLKVASSRRSIVDYLQKSIGRAILWGNAESEAVDINLFREGNIVGPVV